MKRFCLVVFAGLLVACGGGGGSGPPMITAVVVSGDSTVVLNGTRQLTATALAGGSPLSTGVTFQWTSSDTTRATVSGAGLVSGVRLGATSVTARAVLNGTPTSIVSGGKAMRTRVGTIVITPGTPSFASLHDSVLGGAEARDALNAAVPGLTFTWQSRAAGVASATARANTAQADLVAVGNGSTKIVVTADGVSDSITATVQQIATTLAISPDTVTFSRLDSILTPVITATDARGNAITGSALTWTTQSSAVATVNAGTGAIQSKGEGQARVIGTSGALADTVRVGVAIIYKSVDIASTGGLPAAIDSALITRLNGTLQLGVIVRDSGNTVVPSPQVTWSLKNSGTVGTVNGTGLITGNGATGRDTVVVVARTARDSVPLIVRQDVATVVIAPKPATQDLNFVGDTLIFTAQARDAGGATIPGKTPTFSTSRLIVSINGSGVATADSATSSVGIVVKIRVDIDGHKDSTDLRTKQVPASAALSPGSFNTIATIGRTVTASCVVDDSAGARITNHACTWSALTPGVVSFNPATAATTTVTAIGNGTTTVRATAFTNVFGPNSITVDQFPITYTIFPSNFVTPDVQMTVSQSAPFRLEVRDSGNTVDPRPRTDVTWSLSPGTSAAVSSSTAETTRVTTNATPGSETLFATVGLISATRNVGVVATGVKFGGVSGVQAIFSANCDNCHAGAAAPEGLQLESGQAYTHIVDVASGESPLRRVRPFRPDSSYLVHKIQGTQTTVGGSGVRMPFGCSGASCLPAATINLIRNWILQGALNN